MSTLMCDEIRGGNGIGAAQVQRHQRLRIRRRAQIDRSRSNQTCGRR